MARNSSQGTQQRDPLQKQHKQTQWQKEQKQRKVLNVARKAGNALSIVNGVYKIVEAIIQLSNSKGWYEKFKKVTPAANPGRQMNPMMNTTITKEAALGAVCRMVDIQVDWTEYTQSFAFDQAVRSLYQKLREELKSNMPYKFNEVKTYLIRMIALIVKSKQVERDVHWVNHRDPSMFDFSKLFTEEVASTAGYGTNGLTQIDDYSDAKLGLTESNWDRVASMLNSYAMLPTNIGQFISHYFGSVFTDATDGYNTQYIKLVPGQFDWADYDAASDTITYSTINLKDMNLNTLASYLNADSKRFGMITSDLARSKTLTTSIQFEYIKDWQYVLVYDKTFLQALINGYTDGGALTSNGYIRMDALPNTSDDLTQYLFMGGVFKAWLNSSNNPAGAQALSVVLPLSIVRMDLKFSSDTSITWPAGLTQAAVQEENGQVVINSDFAISIQSTMANDSYTTVTQYSEATSNQQIPVAAGEFTLPAGVTALTGKFNADKFSQGLPVLTAALAKSENRYLRVALPILMAGRGALSFIIKGTGVTYLIVNIPLSLTDKNAVIQTPSTPIVIQAGYFKSGHYDAEVKWSYTTTGSVPTGDAQFTTNLGTDDDKQCVITVSNISTAENTAIKNMISISISNNSFLPIAAALTMDFAAGTFNLTIPTSFVSLAPGLITVSSPNEAVVPISLKEVLVSYTSVTAGQVFAAQVNGFGLIAAFAADQFDYHIPFVMRSKSDVSTSLNGGTVTSSSLQNGRVLVKEAYIPYFYNVADMVSVIYDMFYSLVATGAIAQNQARKRKKKKATDSKQESGSGGNA